MRMFLGFFVVVVGFFFKKKHYNFTIIINHNTVGFSGLIRLSFFFNPVECNKCLLCNFLVQILMSYSRYASPSLGRVEHDLIYRMVYIVKSC